MAGWGVVRAWDGKRGEQGVIFQFAHPGIQIGGGKDGEMGSGGDVDPRELELWVVTECLHGRSFSGGHWGLDLMPFSFHLKDPAQTFLLGLDELAKLGLD